MSLRQVCLLAIVIVLAGVYLLRGPAVTAWRRYRFRNVRPEIPTVTVTEVTWHDSRDANNKFTGTAWIEFRDVNVSMDVALKMAEQKRIWPYAASSERAQ